MTFAPFVPVTSHPDDVPTSPIDQPERCRRSWQASMSTGPDMAVMISDGILRCQKVAVCYRPGVMWVMLS
jgi:hypothetical protein